MALGPVVAGAVFGAAAVTTFPEDAIPPLGAVPPFETTAGADGVRFSAAESGLAFFFFFTEFRDFLVIICALIAAFFLFSGLRGSLGFREVYPLATVEGGFVVCGESFLAVGTDEEESVFLGVVFFCTILLVASLLLFRVIFFMSICL